jgi:methyl-accepting chemotaxis protein
VLSVFRRKPLPDAPPLGPPTPGSQDRAPAPPRLDGEMVDVLEADVLKAIRAVTQAIAGANGQVAATKLDIDQIRAAMSGLAAAGRGASAQTTSLAASTEELAATSGEIDAAMGQADARIVDAVETARGANGMIAELARATDEIVGIIDTIAAVARQTNLLALNATIEAARAGAAGRGFAIVASEVKALSVETSNAANDIRSRIGRLRDSAGASIGAVDQVVTVIQGVQPVFGAVRNAVGEQSAAIADLAERAGQASSFVAEVSALA